MWASLAASPQLSDRRSKAPALAASAAPLWAAAAADLPAAAAFVPALATLSPPSAAVVVGVPPKPAAPKKKFGISTVVPASASITEATMYVAMMLEEIMVSIASPALGQLCEELKLYR